MVMWVLHRILSWCTEVMFYDPPDQALISFWHEAQGLHHMCDVPYLAASL